MIYKRTITVKIPDYNYFKEVLEWDLNSMEELEEELADMDETELHHMFNDDGFGNNIEYYHKIEKK